MTRSLIAVVLFSGLAAAQQPDWPAGRAERVKALRDHAATMPRDAEWTAADAESLDTAIADYAEPSVPMVSATAVFSVIGIAVMVAAGLWLGYRHLISFLIWVPVEVYEGVAIFLTAGPIIVGWFPFAYASAFALPVAIAACYKLHTVSVWSRAIAVAFGVSAAVLGVGAVLYHSQVLAGLCVFDLVVFATDYEVTTSWFCFVFGLQRSDLPGRVAGVGTMVVGGYAALGCPCVGVFENATMAVGSAFMFSGLIACSSRAYLLPKYASEWTRYAVLQAVALGAWAVCLAAGAERLPVLAGASGTFLIAYALSKIIDVSWVRFGFVWSLFALGLVIYLAAYAVAEFPWAFTYWVRS